MMTCMAIFAVLAVAAAELFYDRAAAALIFLPLFIPFERSVRHVRLAHYREELTDQFIKALIGIATSLSAGISPENAFMAAGTDMEKMYGKRSPVARDLALVNSQVAMGRRIEDALYELAQRERIKEIYDFAVVFSVAKERGADFPAVISSCVEIMETGREVEREAKIMIRARQYEQRVMCIIPPGILLYLRFSSGSFIDVLYHNVFGVAVMTLCLAVYTAAIFVSEKMGDIRV